MQDDIVQYKFKDFNFHEHQAHLWNLQSHVIISADKILTAKKKKIYFPISLEYDDCELERAVKDTLLPLLADQHLSKATSIYIHKSVQRKRVNDYP